MLSECCIFLFSDFKSNDVFSRSLLEHCGNKWLPYHRNFFFYCQ